MTFTITIPLWLPAAYLAAGLVLWLPLERMAWRGLSRGSRGPFWLDLWRGIRKRPWMPLLAAACWPVAAWQELSMRRRRRRGRKARRSEVVA